MAHLANTGCRVQGSIQLRDDGIVELLIRSKPHRKAADKKEGSLTAQTLSLGGVQTGSDQDTSTCTEASFSHNTTAGCIRQV